MYLIKFCKTKTFLSAISLVMVLAMLNMSLGFHALAGSRTAKAYTGEEIFSGIFFGQGEVDKLFPEIWEQQQAALKANDREYEKIRNEVISEIKTNKPGFFKEFGVEMRSGDHLRVQAALETGEKELGEIKNSEFKRKFAKQTFKNSSKGVALAVAVVFYLWFWVTRPAPSPKPDDGDCGCSRLQRDQLVDMVAVRLAVNTA